jgi:hypothetical protein
VNVFGSLVYNDSVAGGGLDQRSIQHKFINSLILVRCLPKAPSTALMLL